MAALVQEKVNQAISLLQEFGIDLWLSFVRETAAAADPALGLIYDYDLTWQSALILTSSGERMAIVGYFDADMARRTGAYETVIGYHESIQPHLLEALERLDPRQIALNYSVNDVLADGLSYGMQQLLAGYLKGTRFANRLISAERVIGALRGRKTPEELARIRRAIASTQAIYAATFEHVRPGLSEQEIADFMHEQLRTYGLEPAWNAHNCPAVNAGPESAVGHAAPSELRLEPGQILHFDFGVRQEDYCSDVQRVMYSLAPGESAPPEPVQRAFDTVVRAIQRAVETMRPGVAGVEVDAVARQVVLDAGYPEYMHATGHHLGREAHDGGGILGPAWERYGDTPQRLLEPDHVYAVELGVMVPDYGYIGLEEDVLVTERGAEFLTTPQTELLLVRS